jgi:hypothetical protein
VLDQSADTSRLDVADGFDYVESPMAVRQGGRPHVGVA